LGFVVVPSLAILSRHMKRIIVRSAHPLLHKVSYPRLAQTNLSIESTGAPRRQRSIEDILVKTRPSSAAADILIARLEQGWPPPNWKKESHPSQIVNKH